MAKKLWDKGLPIDDKIEAFTIGKDNEWDLRLAPYDVQGSIAHVKMLASREPKHWYLRPWLCV